MTVSWPEVPTEADLRKHRALSVPLVKRANRDASVVDRRGLGRTLERYVANASRPTSERLQILTDYLVANPQSAYAGAVWSEVATTADLSGNFRLAIEACRNAWDSLKGATITADGAETVGMAEDALGRLAMLYVRTAKKNALIALLEEAKGRAGHPNSASALDEARAAVAWWQKDPVANIVCGITAYNLLAARQGSPRLDKHAKGWQPDGEQTAEAKAEDEEYLANGMSAARLLERIANTGVEYRLVKRESGAEVPVPSIVHFTFGGEEGHYSAAVEGDVLNTRINDPHLRFEGLMENTVLNAQASGFFIVQAHLDLPPGFREATVQESLSIFGRSSCPEGRSPGCNSGTCGNADPGMAVYTLSKNLPGVLMQDRPLSYQPLYGPDIDFTLQYRQIHLGNDDLIQDVSNLGPRWSHSFLSYIRAENGAALPSATDLRWVTSEGTFFKFTGTGPTWNHSLTSMPTITFLSSPTGYRLTYKDGSNMDFTQANSASAPTR